MNTPNTAKITVQKSIVIVTSCYYSVQGIVIRIPSYYWCRQSVAQLCPLQAAARKVVSSVSKSLLKNNSVFYDDNETMDLTDDPWPRRFLCAVVILVHSHGGVIKRGFLVYQYSLETNQRAWPTNPFMSKICNQGPGTFRQLPGGYRNDTRNHPDSARCFINRLLTV